MNILNIPYFAGGLSHLIPLYVLHHKYIKYKTEIRNQFLVNNHLQNFLKIQGINSVSIDYFTESDLQLISNDYAKIQKYVLEKQKEAFGEVKPTLIIEDTSLSSPLIAEKNNIPRISIQRTGVFRSIDDRYKNSNHIHSMQKGNYTKESDFILNSKNTESNILSESDTHFLEQYAKPKVKIIPGVPSIECLSKDIENRESYFYSGPLIVKNIPSKNLLVRLGMFFELNKHKPIVFVTMGTVDKTPVKKYIEYFVKRNYAVITTINCEINEEYKQNIFYNKLLPLDYICKISDLVVHQCGSGMYHYPIMAKTAFLTIGTKCYDREDIAQRLQILGVSGHIPHPDDNPDYWSIFINYMNKFEKNTLTDYVMMGRLKNEIEKTIKNFRMEEVIKYALS